MSDEPKPTMGSSPVSEAFEAALIQFQEVALENKMLLAVLAFGVEKRNGHVDLQIAITPGMPSAVEIPILEGTVKCLRYRLKQLLH